MVYVTSNLFFCGTTSHGRFMFLQTCLQRSFGFHYVRLPTTAGNPIDHSGCLSVGLCL